MSETELKAIGQRIREQRIYLGYTRESLSEQLGITPKFCSDIELGQKGMSIQTLCNLSRTLKVSTDYILFGKEAGSTASSTADPLFSMIHQCPAQKRDYLENILKSFLLAID